MYTSISTGAAMNVLCQISVDLVLSYPCKWTF